MTAVVVEAEGEPLSQRVVASFMYKVKVYHEDYVIVMIRWGEIGP